MHQLDDGAMNPVPLENAGGLVACAVLGCLVVAIANGANDIANSMGTSVGAHVLTVRPVIVLGCIAEFFGAMTMGQFVTKEIARASSTHRDVLWMRPRWRHAPYRAL